MEEFWKVSWLRNNPYLFTQNDASLFCWEITLFLNLSSTFLYASKILKLTKWCLCISIKSSNLCLFVCMPDQTYEPLDLISRQRWVPKLFNESTAVSKNKFPWYFAENIILQPVIINPREIHYLRLEILPEVKTFVWESANLQSLISMDKCLIRMIHKF